MDNQNIAMQCYSTDMYVQDSNPNFKFVKDKLFLCSIWDTCILKIGSVARLSCTSNNIAILWLTSCRGSLLTKNVTRTSLERP